MDFLRNFFSQTLGLGTQKERLLDDLTLEGVTRYMQSERCRKVICLVGAGISTSAGIPDFRSPSTGLYANLEKYNLPYPEAIFEIGYFKVCAPQAGMSVMVRRARGSPDPSSQLTRGIWVPTSPPVLSPTETPRALLCSCQGTLSWAVQADRLSLLHPPAEGEGPTAALLHAEHRHARASGGAGA